MYQDQLVLEAGAVQLGMFQDLRFKSAPQESTLFVAEAVQLGMYQDRRFKSAPEETTPPTLETVALIGFTGDARKVLDRAPHFAAGPSLVGLACDLVSAPPNLIGAPHLAAGVALARDLVSAPPNYVTPTALAD
ncbi:hypothetical protein T484DRAFT_1825527, partial [Baffinella frigidus]